MSNNHIAVIDLKEGYSIFGNKGNCWNNNAHIYKSGVGTLCATPALSTNWAVEWALTHVGCPKCISVYNNSKQQKP